MPASRLYRADTGALIANVDLGTGLRGKAFLDEISQFCMEAAVSPGLGATGPLQGYTREANYPTFLTGEFLSSNPIGQAPVIPAYTGIQTFIAHPNRFTFAGLGVTTYGQIAPTVPGETAANYGGAGAGDAYVPTPAGCSAKARATGNNAAAYNCTGATSLGIIVNGITYRVTIADIVSGATIAAVTNADVVQCINNASIPGIYAVITAIAANNPPRILTTEEGFCQTLQIVNDSAGAVIFAGSGALGATVRGAGMPLNEMARQATGLKTQRRILPQSVIITAGVGGNAITVTDNGLGVLAGNNGLGQTAAGTIAYATGVFNVIFSGVTTTAPTVVYQTLTPIDLETPVRVPRNGLNLAIL